MALEIEDGTGKSDATSWISHEDAKAWLEAMGYTDWPEEEAAGEALLLRAIRTVIIPKYEGRWRGELAYTGQSLPWPRRYYYDAEESWVQDGYIPQAVIDLQVLTAHALLTNPDFDLPQERGVIAASDKIGPISESRQFSSGTTLGTSYPLLSRAARGLLKGGRGQVEIIRS